MEQPSPKIEPLNISEIIQYCKTCRNKKEKLDYLKKYKYIQQDYKFLYNIIINNDLNNENLKDIQILNYMLQQTDNIKNNRVTKKEGEVAVGSLLVDTYVKPMLDKNKKK
jgi:hypothetical protein